MTVSYNSKVSTSTGHNVFLKLLLRWRASIYKLVWKDLLVFLCLYFVLNLSYCYLMNEQQKFYFESVVAYCQYNDSLIPLSFVLGFYVSIVMKRWWKQIMTLPWPDPIAVYVSTLLRGQDDIGRVMRRTVMRYVCLSLTMVLTMIAPGVKKRFPTLEHLIDAGMLVENEMLVIKDMNEKFPKHAKHWMPIVWASSIITRARKENRIRDDFSVKTIIDELNTFRFNCDMLRHFDTISIPLVYTQVVTLAVYTFFMGSVMGKQWTEKTNKEGYLNTIDEYFPFFSTLEFFFYMGWLKVAETLICPFGEDDDDFELNWLIDRNLAVTYFIVDEMNENHPELIRDQFWDEIFPIELPYPADEGDKIRDEPPEASTAKLDLRKSEIRTLSSTAKLNFRKSELQIAPIEEDTTLKIHWKRISSLTSSLSPFKIEPESDESPMYGRSHFSLSSEASLRNVNEDSSNLSLVTYKKAKPDLSDTEKVISDEKDDFDRLKEERERERMERHKQKMARTVEVASNLRTDINLTNLVTEILSNSSINRKLSHQHSSASQIEEPKDKNDPNV